MVTANSPNLDGLVADPAIVEKGQLIVLGVPPGQPVVTRGAN